MAANRYLALLIIVLVVLPVWRATTVFAASTEGMPQLSLVASAPVLTLHSHGIDTTTVQVLNPGTEVFVEFVLVPVLNDRTSVARTATFGPADASQVACATPTSTARQPATMVPLTTAKLVFENEPFNTAMTSATVIVVPVSPSSAAKRQAVRLCGAPIGQAPGTATELPMPVEISLTLHRLTGARLDLLLPLMLGALYAFVIVIWIRVSVCTRKAGVVYAGSTWNFKDSLATNITAASAILGSLLSAAGATSTLLPGIQVSSFALLSALWGGVIVLAPLLLGLRPPASARPGRCIITTHAAHRRAKVSGHADAEGEANAHAARHLRLSLWSWIVAGALILFVRVCARRADTSSPGTADDSNKGASVRRGMLLLALFVTLTGAGGELATVGVLVRLAYAPTVYKDVATVLLIAVAAIVGVYAYKTTVALIKSGKERPRSALHSGHDTSLLI